MHMYLHIHSCIYTYNKHIYIHTYTFIVIFRNHGFLQTTFQFQLVPLGLVLIFLHFMCIYFSHSVNPDFEQYQHIYTFINPRILLKPFHNGLADTTRKKNLLKFFVNFFFTLLSCLRLMGSYQLMLMSYLDSCIFFS